MWALYLTARLILNLGEIWTILRTAVRVLAVLIEVWAFLDEGTPIFERRFVDLAAFLESLLNLGEVGTFAFKRALCILPVDFDIRGATLFDLLVEWAAFSKRTL